MRHMQMKKYAAKVAMPHEVLTKSSCAHDL